MAHRSSVTSATKNVGHHDQLWRYDYTVTWLGGNGAIREVIITKTPTALVKAPVRFSWLPPFIFFNDPRMDLRAPTDWTLVPGVGVGSFQFMIQPPPGGNLNSYIPPLAPPPPFAPVAGVAPPVTGQFTVYSVENPVPHTAVTVDHLGVTFPAPPAPGHPVEAPNTKFEITLVTGSWKKEKGGYRYTYFVSSRVGRIKQAIFHLSPDVKISAIRSSRKSWSTFRVGFNKPRDLDRADGKPTPREKGILFFGSFDDPVGPEEGVIWVSFFSASKPGYIAVQANRFQAELVGPVPAKPKKP
jgi:hypothetical protein